MKYPGYNGIVVTVHGKIKDARRCYQENLKITKASSTMLDKHGKKRK
jgi:hypothetical protein